MTQSVSRLATVLVPGGLLALLNTTVTGVAIPDLVADFGTEEGRALVLDLVKRGDAEGTWQANHFSWRIRSVIWAGVLYIVTAPFWLLGLFLFNPVWVVISLWFLYRIVRGMLAMSKNQAVDA